MNSPTKVFIVDSDRLTLITLSLWLEHLKDFEIVGTALANNKLEQKILDSQPELVVLNLNSSGLEAVSTLRRIKHICADIPVIILYDGEMEDLDGPLSQESDAQLSPETSLKDFVEVMRKYGFKHKVVTSPHFMTKAG
jgi:DNA-binding NarL/FixJ family response regulator